MTTDRAAVPCNGCTACCRNEALVLHPEKGDNPSEYLTQVIEHPLKGGPVFALQHRENGDCIYLGPGGCTIWDRAPVICREFDCRWFLRRFGNRAAQRRAMKAGFLTREIYDAAKRISR